MSVDLLWAVQPPPCVARESQLTRLQMLNPMFPKIRSHRVPLHWGPSISFLLKSRRNGWNSYEHLQVKSVQKVIPTTPCQKLLSSEQKQQHGQHRCAAAQRRECSLEQLSVSVYKSKPACELLEIRSLIQNPFLYFSTATEGFTVPKQGQKHIKHILLQISVF